MTCSDDPIAEYHLGQQVTLYVDFANDDGDAADPDTVLLRILEGDGSTVTDVIQASLSNPSVGRWEYDLTLPLDGDKTAKPWLVRWEGTSGVGGVIAATEMRFEAIPTPFYPTS
jgi:hypothetical protein